MISHAVFYIFKSLNIAKQFEGLGFAYWAKKYLNLASCHAPL